MKICFLVLCALVVNYSWGQKPSLGIDDYKSWSIAGGAKISNNGKYVSFLVSNQPQVGQFKVILREVNKSWSSEYVNAINATFADNSKYFLCIQPGNRLTITSLREQGQKIIPRVTRYSLCKTADEELVICLQKEDTTNKLVIIDLAGKVINSYGNVENFWISDSRSVLVFKSKRDSDDWILTYVFLTKSKIQEREIYHGREPGELIIDNDGKQVAFAVPNTAQNEGKSIWYFNPDDHKMAIVKNPGMESDGDMVVKELSGFNKMGNLVICRVGKKNRKMLKEISLDEVDIKSYYDSNLQKKRESEDELYFCTWNLGDNIIRQIQKDGDHPFYPNINNNYQLILSGSGHKGEWNWNENSILSCSLVDLSNGSRKRMTNIMDRNAESYVLSPHGRWIVFYDPEKQAYFSINVLSNEIRNITEGVKTTWTSYDNDDLPVSKFLNIGVGGFDSDEKEVYLYDQYDIFLVDLAGRNPPKCLTRGYGKENSIVFRLAFDPSRNNSKRILLTAFNRKTKDDGFFELSDRGVHVLRKLIMAPSIFSGPEESKYFFWTAPKKAKDANCYILQKMDAEHSPNVFWTKDFEEIKQVSSVYTEKRFNWLSTELICFNTLSGGESQGVLYKPENFDSTKKYPIIFYCYEKISECLNLYLAPGLCDGPLNIPYFVSNGYLVFTPDIHFQIGYPGRSSFNTIMGAVRKLSERTYIDTTKMGLQGHSFGGFQINYIVTHTNKFAAACSAAGFTNFVSAYGSIIGSGYSRQGQYELYRDRIGADLWSRPDLYIENSPVLLLNQVTTPMLIMHNKDDEDVPVGQGIELFTGLRRLGKVSYLLQYKGQDHMVVGPAARDYTQRMMQFFDYYLKNSVLPSWMTDKQPKVLKFNPMVLDSKL